MEGVEETNATLKDLKEARVVVPIILSFNFPVWPIITCMGF